VKASVVKRIPRYSGLPGAGAPVSQNRRSVRDHEPNLEHVTKQERFDRKHFVPPALIT